MNGLAKTLVVVCILFITIGCTPDPKSGQGFTLPEGDAERGKATFVQLQCNACHTIEGIELEPIESGEAKLVALGGEKSYVVTYGELVTSIINPSHRFAWGNEPDAIKEDGVSKMRLYNDQMTVTQLSDLVTFLQSHYELKLYHPTPYVPYY